MLTRELAIAEYDFPRGRVLPDRLTRGEHAHYLDYAARMLDVYQDGVGRTRRELHRSIRSVFAPETDCPVRRIDAFCKLLDDASEFSRDPRGRATALRQEVFQLAAQQHPLVHKADRLFENEEQQVKAAIAQTLGRPWHEIDADLFADVMELHRLEQFTGFPDPTALLARYNVAQAQAALFDAVSLTVWAQEDFKTILRHAKLARLMHTIEGQGPEQYRLTFDGPASVLRQTRRYGAAFARFIPALLSCRNWRMQATLKPPRAKRTLKLELSHADGLTTHVAPPTDFDSDVERAFARKWGDEPREGWKLIREGEILQRGQKVFLPDFVFRHEDGRSAMMEIVGFWTPEYLSAKCETLKLFRSEQILLAVARSAVEQLPEITRDAIVYKSALKIKDVLARLKAE